MADVEHLTPPREPFRPLGMRLVRIVITVGALCALVAVALQAVVSAGSARAASEMRLNEIRVTRMPMLSAALWDIEPALAQAQINDLASMPEIGGITLVTAAGIDMRAGQSPPSPAQADAVLEVKPPRPGTADLGRLYIAFDNSYVLRHVLADTALTAAFIGVFTVLLCVLLIRFLRAEVGLPLQRLLEHVNAISPADLGGHYESGRPPRPWRDELDQLAAGFAGLHQGIARYVEERNHAEAALAEQRDQLEAKVAARTRDLEVERDKADRASRSKSEFLANMSHEIRTPINAIAGFTTLALRTELTPKQADYLGKIDDATQGLLHIISDLLDFSKIEAGHMELESISFRLDEVMDTTVTYLGPLIERKGLELLIKVGPDVPVQWTGDPLRLGQVLVNLCSNAVKFTERGEIEIAVRLQSKTATHGRLLFSVRDTGIGLTPEQAGKLFHAFTQADTSTTRKFGGTGLGLVICQRLVQLMNGRIWLESEKGAGTTFHFEVELGVAPDARTQPRLPAELAGKPALVVDDNANAREILSAQLEELGMAPHAVASGEAALAALRKASDEGVQYPVVLMDWKMPGMDGIETMRAIRSDGSIARTPVIIMVTAYAREQVLGAARGNTMPDNILLKPVTVSLLAETLSRAGSVRGQVRSGTRPARPVRLPGVRLLLVEDNPVNQQLAKELLEMEGARVRIAANGRIALDVLAEAGLTQFDAVLMDLQMPEMDGYEATQRIRALPENAGLPVIAMTAHVMSEERERCLALGMQDHLAKPIDPELLVAKLMRWIGPEKLAQAARDGTPSAETNDTSAAALEKLPGIDIGSVLNRCNGNVTLLQHLLRTFRSRYGEADRELRELCASGRWTEARMMAHTIKGAAANMAMNDLAAAAGALEQALKQAEAKAGGAHAD